ncbi:hypothetical protein DL767_007373 [Monosporascus sp. MG133]|nr:hypothetical protein DL767_007373 [Monosporascus sp. MG133]
MEALTIFGAVTGGISAASEILKALDKAISTASKIRGAPEQAISTLRDVRMMRLNMIRFQQLLDTRTHAYDRESYIPLDDALNTFTDCVTSLDELESLLKPLTFTTRDMDLADRLEWAMKDKRIELLSRRVHDAQSSLGLMLTILSHESLIEVQKALARLPELAQRIGHNVAHFNRRSISINSVSTIIRHNQDHDDTSTIRPRSTVRAASRATSVLRPDPIIIPDTAPEDDTRNLDQEAPSNLVARYVFEEALQSSRVYRRAPKWDLEDVSFRSSVMNPHAMSLLSKLSTLSLGDVSTISVVALPLFSTDFRNSQHYRFGEVATSASSASVLSAQQQNHNDCKSSPPAEPPLLYPTPSNAPDTPPSPPRSPTTPVRAGVTRVLKTLKRALDPGIVKIIDGSYELTPTKSLFTPYTSPTPNLRLDDAKSIKPQHPVPSLNQLSTLQLEESKLHLFHGEDSVPCRGAINSTHDDDDDDDDDLDLAVSHGFLDTFRCKECRTSLAKIIQRRNYGWSTIEIWCGAQGCLGAHRELKPCGCYTKIKELGLPTDEYFGCRILSEQEVKCARCFARCPYCNSEPEEVYAIGRELYIRQHLLLKAQRWIFDNVIAGPQLQVREKNLNYNLAQLEVRLEGLTGSGNTSIRIKSILNERQRVLNWRRTILPTWREMNILVAEGSQFYQVSVQKMRDIVDDSDETLQRLAAQNWDFVPGPNELDQRDYCNCDADDLFDEVGKGMDFGWGCRPSFGRGSSLRDRVATPTPADASDTERAAKRQKRGKEAEKPAQADDQGGKKDDMGKREEKPKKENKAAILKRFDNDLDHYFKDNAEKETPRASASKQDPETPAVKDAGDKETDKARVEKRKEGAE